MFLTWPLPALLCPASCPPGGKCPLPHSLITTMFCPSMWCQAALHWTPKPRVKWVLPPLHRFCWECCRSSENRNWHRLERTCEPVRLKSRVVATVTASGLIKSPQLYGFILLIRTLGCKGATDWSSEKHKAYAQEQQFWLWNRWEIPIFVFSLSVPC